MRLSKFAFFLLLIGVFVLPIILFRVNWLLHTKSVTGYVSFMGKDISGAFPVTYPVVRFSSNGQDTIFFNGMNSLELKPGTAIGVRYQQNNPHDARLNRFDAIWTDTIIYAGLPFLLISVSFLHRDLIPAKAKIVLGRKPFIRLVLPDDR